MVNVKTRLFGYKKKTIAWLETIVIAILSALIWYFPLSTGEHHTEQSIFLWAIFGPLIVALRYGFAKGVVCALMCILGFLFITHLSDTNLKLSLSSAIAIILCAMLAGEFHDIWYEEIEKYKLDYDYMARKLNSFTQNYHLLKVSHDQLEQKIASDTVNLRSSMQALQMISAKNPNYELPTLAEPFLDIFRDTGGVQVAGIYQVKDGAICPQAIATLGNEHKLETDDPMLLDMLEKKRLVSISKNISPQQHRSRYQLCIPLTDTHDQLQAVVLVEKAKFFMLTNINIALMSVLANYAADLISIKSTMPSLEPSQASLFKQYLERALENIEQFGTDSSLIIYIDRSAKHAITLNHVVDYRRGADVYWNCWYRKQNAESFPALAVLLPLTELVDAQAYVLRLEDILNQQLGQNSKNIDVVGPLSLNQNWNQIQNLIKDLGS